MKTFTPKDIIRYYDDTEVHYRMFWKFEKSLGLHYGVWDEGTKNLADAILNTNELLAQIGNISKEDFVLDAGCGVGGSSIYLARTRGCKVIGITLSEKQAATASEKAKQQNVSELVSFKPMNYCTTDFDDNSFDAVWAIESMQTASDKSLFLKEVSRILKPDGRLLIADVFKTHEYSIDDSRIMQEMINGWAMSDLLTQGQLIASGKEFGFSLMKSLDVTKEVYPSVLRIFGASVLGMFGTFFYNLFKRASYFSRIHYRTGLAQYIGYKKKLWDYKLIALNILK